MASTAIRRSPITVHRVLIAEMDSIAQRARYDAKDHHAATTELSGMLRIGRLVSEHILLTDVMVLDGCYFMRLGPEGVIRELGATEAQFPLTITGHYPSLGEGLSARLSDADFSWSLDNVHRGREVPASVTNTWQQWLDYVERGIVRYEQQTGQFALPAGANYPLGMRVLMSCKLHWSRPLAVERPSQRLTARWKVNPNASESATGGMSAIWMGFHG